MTGSDVRVRLSSTTDRIMGVSVAMNGPIWQYGQSLIIILLACLVSTPSQAESSAAKAGRDLAQKVYDRPDGQDASIQGVMVLQEAGHEPRVRRMYTYRLDRGGREVWSLIRFTTPADIDGVGLLTLDHPGDASDQWLYLPALDRSRRVASNRKGGRFVGSDLYYEDLQDREVDMDSHRLLKPETIEGVLCEVLESVPIDPDNSVYNKRISWIHPQTLVALRVDFFQPGEDKPVKRMMVHRIEKVQNFWTVMDSTMTDLASGHSTRLTVEKVQYDRQLPEKLFARQTLEDPDRESNYRP